jgi:DNA-binding LacI/PurR family transcriptional regulator
MPRINQQAIAEKLNISRTTVSRCFSNHPAIHPDTRAKVLKLAMQMGYRYAPPKTNPGRKKSQKTIALLFASNNEVFNHKATDDLLKGVSEKAGISSYHLSIHFVDPDELHVTSKTRKLFQRVSLGDLAGIIFVYPFKNETVEVLKSKLPCVSVLRDYGIDGVDTISINITHVMRQHVKRLVQAGHTKIGFLGKLGATSPCTPFWANRCLGSYGMTLYEQSIPLFPDWIVHGSNEETSMTLKQASIYIRNLIKNEGVNAWICASDLQGYQLMQALDTLGLKCPRDYSLTGIDSREPPEGFPKLTSQRVSFVDIGYSSVTTLLRRMENLSSASRQILVESYNVPGESILG